tara:strand:- start:2 stop:244 length:243 start_codon:yes stop_codon:yes gene_type:complete
MKNRIPKKSTIKIIESTLSNRLSKKISKYILNVNIIIPTNAFDGRYILPVFTGIKNVDIANTKATLDKFEPIALPIASTV